MTSRASAALILVSALLCSAQAPTSSFVQGTPADEIAIRAIVGSQSADHEDPHVAQDLDWENAFGIRYTNLTKRNDWFNANVKPQFKNATNDTLEVKIRFLEPTVAVADEYWHVAGQVYAGETKPGADRWGRTTYIFKREAGVWTEVMERVADLRSPYFKHYDSLPTAVPVRAATLASYAGRYQTDKGAPLAEITVAGDHLTVNTPRGRYVAIPVSDTEFLSFQPDDLASYLEITFSTAPGGAGAPPRMKASLSYPEGTVLATAFRVP